MRRFWICGLALLRVICFGADTEPVVRGRAIAPLSTKPVEWPRVVLSADATWQLNLPGGIRFDASALLRTKDGKLLTVNDRGATVYEIRLKEGEAELLAQPEFFTQAALTEIAKDLPDRFDCEGLAQDAEGRIYVCEEGRRWILRCDPAGKVERLPIDWAPVKKHFSPIDGNASFEGITIGDGNLYVANERQMGRVIVVDLKTNRIVKDFVARPSNGHVGDIHYSDLSWFDGHLFALLRHHRVVLEIDPKTEAVLAEFQFRELEDAPDVAYRRLYPTGAMEGLSVDKDYIWLLTDNNGQERVKHPGDKRPTLFRCKRPKI